MLSESALQIFEDSVIRRVYPLAEGYAAIITALITEVRRQRAELAGVDGARWKHLIGQEVTIKTGLESCAGIVTSIETEVWANFDWGMGMKLRGDTTVEPYPAEEAING